MAQSGTTFTLQSGSYQGRYMKLTCTSTQDIANNKTNISWKLESIGGSSSYYATICKVNINGTEVYSIDKGASYGQFPVAKGETTGSTSVAMNNDGSHGAITIYMDTAIYVSSTTRYSDTWQLNTIPRYPTINSFTVDKVGGSSTQLKFNWSADSTIDYLWYSTNNGASWTGYDTADGTSGNFTVGGLASNTGYNCKIRLRRKDSQLTKDSGTVWQSTYQQPTANISTANITGYNGLSQIKVSWSSNMDIAKVEYSRDNGGSWYNAGDPNASSGNYTYTGLSEGTSYNFRVRLTATTGSCVTTSGTSAKATYRRVSGNLYINGTKVATNNGQRGLSLKNGDTLEIKDISNSASCSYQLFFENPDNQNHYISPTQTGTTAVSMTAEQIRQRLQYMTTTNSQEFNVGLATLNTSGNRALYYEFYGTLSVVNSNPTFAGSNWTYQDTNASTVALTGNNQILVNGFSKLRVSVDTAATGVNYATISQYAVSGCTNGSSTTTGNIDCANATNGGTITVTAKDSRGNSTITTKTATFKDYFVPTLASISATRNNGGVDTKTTLTFNGTWWNGNFGASANTLTAVYRYNSGSTWSEPRAITLTTSGNNYSFNDTIYGDLDANGFTLGTTFTIEVTITDELNGGKSWTTVLNSGTPAIAISENNVSIGAQYDTSLGGKLQVSGNITLPKNNAVQFGGVNTLRANSSNNTILSAEGNIMYFRPNGNVNSNEEMYLDTSGNVYAYDTFVGKMNNRPQAVVGSENPNTSGWYKVCTSTMSGWGNTNIIWVVSENFSGSTKGILCLEMRSNNGSIECWNLRWLVRGGGLDADYARLTISGNTWTLYFYRRTAQYGRITFHEIMHNGIADKDGYTVTYYSSDTPESTTPTANTISSDGGHVLNATQWDGINYDMGTSNDNDTWVPVLNGNNMQHTTKAKWTSVQHTNHSTNQYHLATLSCLSFWNGAYNRSNNSNLKYAHQGEIQCKPVSLYDNANGTTGTVTLSQSSANFTYLEIFYKETKNQQSYGSVKIYSPNGKYARQQIIEKSDNDMRLNTTRGVISGTSITRDYGAVDYLNGGRYDVQEMSIVKVIGYR